MKIGFVSTWFERGAAYVTKSYIDVLKSEHDVYVYARGGEQNAKNDPKWNLSYVTWGLNLPGTTINKKHFFKWVKESRVEIIFFNEQRDYKILALLKKEFPEIKIGSYIDYYKENEIENFWIYDFLICNTKRHFSVFKEHPQCYYVPWGTNIDLFKPKFEYDNRELIFFHSVGMSLRKGTDILLKVFIEKELYKYSKLIIHSQLNFEKHFGYSSHQLKDFNIEVVEKTVGAPGLYNLGDVYVYPTTLDGLGLTIYEALSCGLPVITTDNAPMNEIVNSEIGFLVEVEKYYSRSDGYYWPLSICRFDSLYEGMKYFINNSKTLRSLKENSRHFAELNLDWNKNSQTVNKIFEKTEIITNQSEADRILKVHRKEIALKTRETIYSLIPDRLVNILRMFKL